MIAAVQCIPLVEPNAVPEIYVDGIAAIEQRGPNLKLTFYSVQKPTTGGPHDLERVIVARFVMPAQAVASAAMQAIAATDTVIVVPTQ